MLTEPLIHSLQIPSSHATSNIANCCKAYSSASFCSNTVEPPLTLHIVTADVQPGAFNLPSPRTRTVYSSNCFLISLPCRFSGSGLPSYSQSKLTAKLASYLTHFCPAVTLPRKQKRFVLVMFLLWEVQSRDFLEAFYPS